MSKNNDLPKIDPITEAKPKRKTISKPSRKDHNKMLGDIPIANELLYKETAARCKTSPKQVEECAKIVGQFIAKTMKNGAFETIMIPYFGKFKAKTTRVQWSTHKKVMAIIPTHLNPKTPEDGTTES